MTMKYLSIYVFLWFICAIDFYISILFYVLHFCWIYLLILAGFFVCVKSLKGLYIYVLYRAGHWSTPVDTATHSSSESCYLM